MRYKIFIYINDNKLTLKANNIVSYNFSKNILNNGKIVNQMLFEKYLSKILKCHIGYLKLFLTRMYVIYNENLSNSDTLLIKSVFDKLIFKKIIYYNDIKNLNLTQKTLYIFATSDYLRLYYKDCLNQSKKLSISLNNISSIELKFLLLNRIKSKNIYIINYTNYINYIVDSITKNYYIFNDKNYIINNLNNFT